MKSGHVRFAEVARMPLAMKYDEPADPQDRGFFSAPTVMSRADGFAHPIEQLRTTVLHKTTMPSSLRQSQDAHQQTRNKGPRPAG